MSAKARRAVATSLVVLGLAVLVLGAVREAMRVPVATSLSVARRFWKADRKARLLNSLLFRADVEYGVAVIEADRAWPLSVDVDLVLPAGLGAEAVDAKRSGAALVLAPRRIYLSLAPLGERRFVLAPHGVAR